MNEITDMQETLRTVRERLNAMRIAIGLSPAQVRAMSIAITDIEAAELWLGKAVGE